MTYPAREVVRHLSVKDAITNGKGGSWRHWLALRKLYPHYPLGLSEFILSDNFFITCDAENR